MQKIKEIYSQIIMWYYRKRGLRVVTKNTLMGLAADRITIDWITACIIDRKQSNRRQELVQAQQKEKEDILFLKWLQSLK